MSKSNLDIKDYAKKHNVRMWQLANYLGIHETSLCRILRYDLSEEKKKEYFGIIDKLAKCAKEYRSIKKERTRKVIKNTRVRNNQKAISNCLYLF